MTAERGGEPAIVGSERAAPADQPLLGVVRGRGAGERVDLTPAIGDGGGGAAAQPRRQLGDVA